MKHEILESFFLVLLPCAVFASFAFGVCVLDNPIA
jgi:preprotein translocase subunit SecE